MYQYKAKVIDVYDGDTVTLIIDLGCHVSIERPIRLYGINTPELRGTSRVQGEKARDFLRGLIMDKQVFIETFKDKGDKYGRLLGKIYLGVPGEPDTIYVNDELIKNGFAVPYLV